MIRVNNTFFWYGESYKRPMLGDFLSDGIDLYSSSDLQSWTFEGLIFNGTRQMNDMPLDPPYRIERPKVILSMLWCSEVLGSPWRHREVTMCTHVIQSKLCNIKFFRQYIGSERQQLCALQILYNAAYSQYVLLFHADTPSFSYPAVGVAVAEDIRGPYTWMRAFKPDGLNSYDMGVFQEPDGTAFLVRSINNDFLGISQLTPNYTDTTGLISVAPRVRACLTRPIIKNCR